MLVLLALIPWVLTVAALLIIMAKKKKNEEDYPFQDDDDDEMHQTVRVAVYEDKAYWVMDNVFYESDVVREPDFSTARPIDTMDLSSKELGKLLEILDDLEKSNNERE